MVLELQIVRCEGHNCLCRHLFGSVCVVCVLSRRGVCISMMCVVCSFFCVCSMSSPLYACVCARVIHLLSHSSVKGTGYPLRDEGLRDLAQVGKIPKEPLFLRHPNV